MELYYVYLLLCAEGSIYTGITDAIDRRIAEHHNGINKTAYTYRRRPVQLIFQQEFNDVLQAIFFEKKLKKWSAKKKMALVEGNLDLLQILSECRNATHCKYRPDHG
jgi:putative endonuclease